MNGVLKKVRTALRMTQTKLAASIGISRGLWSVHEGKDEREEHDAPPHGKPLPQEPCARVPRPSGCK